MADRRYKLFRDGLTGKRSFEVGDLTNNDMPIWSTTSLSWTLVNSSTLTGVTDHGALTGLADDDHPQYAQIAAAETITGAWGFTTHPTGLDHGTIGGLGDDDHSIYLLASDATNRATFAANWLDLTDGGATTLHSHASSSIDHGGLTGLADDDHTQYLLVDGTRAATTLSIGAIDTMTVNGGAVTAHLQIHDDTLAVAEIHTHSATAGAGGAMYFARSRGTEGAETAVSSGDTLGIIAAVGHDGTDYATGAAIYFTVGTTPGANDMPTNITFYTSPDGSQTLTERLNIGYDGVIQFNNAYTFPTADGTASYVLQTNGAGALSFGQVATAGIADSAVTYAKIQNVGTDTVLGRTAAGTGVVTALSASDVLDMIGSTRGSVLYRGVSSWSALTPGTSGYVLTSNGAGADPSYQAVSSSGLPAPDFTSSEITIATGGVATAHGLGAIPTMVIGVLRCKTADKSYAVGDEVLLTGGPMPNGNVPVALAWNATNIYAMFYTTGVYLLSRGSTTWSTITNGSWKIVFYAWA